MARPEAWPRNQVPPDNEDLPYRQPIPPETSTAWFAGPQSASAFLHGYKHGPPSPQNTYQQPTLDDIIQWFRSRMGGMSVGMPSRGVNPNQP